MPAMSASTRRAACWRQLLADRASAADVRTVAAASAWRRRSPLGCDALVVDAATATPDADFSSGAERKLDQLRSRVLDVLSCASQLECWPDFRFGPTRVCGSPGLRQVLRTRPSAAALAASSERSKLLASQRLLLPNRRAAAPRRPSRSNRANRPLEQSARWPRVAVAFGSGRLLHGASRASVTRTDLRGRRLRDPLEGTADRAPGDPHQKLALLLCPWVG
jgi:hypothetical protein